MKTNTFLKHIPLIPTHRTQKGLGICMPYASSTPTEIILIHFHEEWPVLFRNHLACSSHLGCLLHFLSLPLARISSRKNPPHVQKPSRYCSCDRTPKRGHWKVKCRWVPVTTTYFKYSLKHLVWSLLSSLDGSQTDSFSVLFPIKAPRAGKGENAGLSGYVIKVRKGPSGLDLGCI